MPSAASLLSFQLSPEAEVLCNAVLRTLIAFCGYTKAEAIELVNKNWAADPFLDDNDMRLHEHGYYWAMTFHHGKYGNAPIVGDWWWKQYPNQDSPPPDYIQRMDAVDLG
jgi:hypothetical protein